MSLQYIIDGYNLIHHPLFSRTYKKTDNPAQALLLCIRTHRLTGSVKNDFVVVFDGYPPYAYQQDHSRRVIFSGDESADEYIKRVIEKAGNARTLVVVSDDKEIVFCAKAYRAQSCSGDEFFSALQDAARTRQESLRCQENERKIGYSQMQKINKEMREKWLK